MLAAGTALGRACCCERGRTGCPGSFRRVTATGCRCPAAAAAAAAFSTGFSISWGLKFGGGLARREFYERVGVQLEDVTGGQHRPELFSCVEGVVHGGDASDAAVLGGLVTGQERTFGQDPLFAFRLLADALVFITACTPV